jgi:type I restriction enzyme S subunit
MKSNYDVLGNHIQLVDRRNTDMITDKVMGINIDKFFMPSVANVIGTDLSKYKLITKDTFACNPMHVGRDERLPVALYSEDTPAIVSPAYFMFEIREDSELMPEYLMMWFRRPEFDRNCWFRTDGSVRGGITWNDICRLEVPVLSREEQEEIILSYKAITNRIELKKKINDNLAA